MFAVDDIDETLEKLRKRGAQLVGEVVRYKDAYRLCYIRGPKGFSSDSPRSSAERRPGDIPLSSSPNQPELPRACLNFSGGVEDRRSGVQLAALLRDGPPDHRVFLA
jgi:hypothetical protein